MLISAIASTGGQRPVTEITRLVSRQFQLNSRLLSVYGADIHPDPCEERVVLLRSDEGYRPPKRDMQVPQWLADRTDTSVVVRDWEGILGRTIKVLPIPGNHFEVFNSQTVSFSVD